MNVVDVAWASEFESLQKGQFLFAIPDDEAEGYAILFQFDFTNRSAGIYVSQVSIREGRRIELVDSHHLFYCQFTG